MTCNSARHIFCHTLDLLYQKILYNPNTLNLVKSKEIFVVILLKIQSTRQESKHIR